MIMANDALVERKNDASLAEIISPTAPCVAPCGESKKKSLVVRLSLMMVCGAVYNVLG